MNRVQSARGWRGVGCEHRPDSCGSFVPVPPDKTPSKRRVAEVDVGAPTARNEGRTAVDRAFTAATFTAPPTIARGDAAEGRPCGLLQHTERKTAMHTLTFNDNERALLIEMLETYLAKMPHEIHQTDNREYRHMLEAKQSTLQQLLQRLQPL
jgi:hypothetical protein